MMNNLEYFDGGAYPQYFFAQYPNGIGLHGDYPQIVRDAIERAQSENTDNGNRQINNKELHPPYTTNLPNGNSVINEGILVKKDASQENSLILSTEAIGLSSKESLDAHTARTQAALERALKEQQHTEEDFSGRNRQLRGGSIIDNKGNNALTIVVPRGNEGLESHGPIVRSPTKAKQMAFAVTNDLIAHSSTLSSVTHNKNSIGTNALSERSSHNGETNVVVPFSVSSWRNKKKLIIPVEQRLAQQKDERRTSADEGIGESVIDLALAMQQASREVREEIEEQERIRAEELERVQAEREAAEAARAKQLLDESAARLRMNKQRHETREERLTRVKLERELRERERVEKRRQALLERAAARLNISVEALEADAELLQTVEANALHAPVSENNVVTSTSAGPIHNQTLLHAPSGDDTVSPSDQGSLQSVLKSNYETSHNSGKALGHSFTGTTTTTTTNEEDNSKRRGVGAEDDDDDGDEDSSQSWRRGRKVKGGIFANAVISNEGIKAEMEALDQLERMQRTGGHSGVSDDGIHWTDHETKEQLFHQNSTTVSEGNVDRYEQNRLNNSKRESSNLESANDGFTQLMKRKRKRL